MDSKIILFKNKKDCCGCGSCMNICPRQAIAMKKDLTGFVFPVIDEEKCIKCGLCKKACAFRKENNMSMKKPLEVYAAASKEDVVLEATASGGIFTVLAKKVLFHNGVVFGAALLHENEQFIVKHIGIDNAADLWMLQGSKYVQSDLGHTYQEVKEYLVNDKIVLFSGTPCQIAGLNSYLGKEYEKLITVDVICHGVPNQFFFNSYIKTLEKKLEGSIRAYKFRDKSLGQGMHTKIEYDDKKGNEKVYITDGYLTSYFFLFLKSYIYRENCYTCPYAQEKRPSDITIGDFWGVYNVHSSEMEKSSMSDDKGISCILVNTKKGKRVIKGVSNDLNMFESTFDKAAAYNGQLKNPSTRSGEREKILGIFEKDGYDAVDKYYRNNFRKERAYYKIKSMIPRSIKQKLKGR